MTFEAVIADDANSSGPAIPGIPTKRPVYGNPKFYGPVDQTFRSYRPYTRTHTISEYRKLWSVWSTGPNDCPLRTASLIAARTISGDVTELAATQFGRMAICLANGLNPGKVETTSAHKIGAQAVRSFGLAKSGSYPDACQRRAQRLAIDNCNLVSRSHLTREVCHAMD